MKKLEECAREPEVIAAVASGRWPAPASLGNAGADNLTVHGQTCSVCQDVAVLASSFRAEQTSAVREAHVPSAAHMWWRAQIRARQEAARTVSRPMTLAQGFGVASAAGLAAAAIAIGLRSGWGSDSGVQDGVRALAVRAVGQLVDLASHAPEATLVFSTIVTCLMLMPVAVYLALMEK